MSWKTVRGNSIALRLSALFILVALGVFLLIGWALYRQVDRSLDLLPQAELDARFSVLESTLNRFGTPDHWTKINNKLNLLSEEDKRIRFWVVSSNPAYDYGHPSELYVPSPKGHRACATCTCLTGPTRTRCWSVNFRRWANGRHCAF